MEVPKPAPKKEASCDNAIKFDWETKARPVRELKHGNVPVPKDFRGQAKSYTLWTLNSLYVNTVVNNNLGVKVNAKGGATLSRGKFEGDWFNTMKVAKYLAGWTEALPAFQRAKVASHVALPYTCN
ncbi:guaA [Symbiodinium sp. CCMP2592]|nr:guaA [Symbiodinium sp. CCMP2592]CAE7508827.1 guaA [Symbiodinium sp. CCMP2592]